jgi:hypothetical protein
MRVVVRKSGRGVVHTSVVWLIFLGESGDAVQSDGVEVIPLSASRRHTNPLSFAAAPTSPVRCSFVFDQPANILSALRNGANTSCATTR